MGTSVSVIHYLDDQPCVTSRETVSKDTLDKQTNNFEVYKKLERLREVDA